MSASPADSNAEPHWIPAEDGYQLALEDGKLVCLNAKGKRLKSVPKKVKVGETGQQLEALKDFLAEHELECLQTVETWMLRSLPVPRKVLGSVWPDPAWSGILKNAVVAAAKNGVPDEEAAGFLRDIREDGVGVVNLDGETLWLDTEELAIPHPILLPDIDDYRELATELGFEQGLQQLFREVHAAEGVEADATSLDAYQDGKFEALGHILSHCRRLGYRTRGGFAICPVWEGGQVVEARYWIGADDPESEAWTGDLNFVDKTESNLKISEVGPVAFSEGVRMAAAIYARRVVEKDEEDN